MCWLGLLKRFDQGGRRPPDFSLKKMVLRLELGLAQQTASLVCPADQLHRECWLGLLTVAFREEEKSVNHAAVIIRNFLLFYPLHSN
jgi:hypothetical protein